jgi:pyridinium-3,5-bisthiocarboxylic acid mononucleotide nickel chelatase
VRFLLIEPFSGASGDMFLGALLDLGVPVAEVEKALRTLPIGGWSLTAEKTTRGGIAATKARVRLDALGGGEEGYATAHAHRHDHPHAHAHEHGHEHHDGPVHGHGHHVQRTAGEIFAIIRASGLPPEVKTRSCDVFAALANAEARVHGLTPETVHFHEVGAVDAIVDICGSVFALSTLGVERVVATTATTGFGLVRCAHGTVPAPAPATVFLMEGLPVRQGPVEGELLTPTGAALLRTLVTDWTSPESYFLHSAGFGAGSSDWAGLPNVLRVSIASTAEAETTPPNLLLEAEFDVDDMRGEDLGFLREALAAAGALDVSFTPLMMKKDRPGHRVTVLFPPERDEAIESVIFRRSSTFGYRIRRAMRRVLDREIIEVATAHGRCRVKIGRHRGEVVQVRPEYEDVAALARATGKPLHEVEAAAIAAYLSARP